MKLDSFKMALALVVLTLALVYGYEKCQPEIDGFRRWQGQIHLDLSSEELPALLALADELPDLKSITIQYEGQAQESFMADLSRLLSTVSLKQLHLKGPGEFPRLLSGMEQLRVLHLDNINLSEIESLNYHMPRLEKLSLIRCQLKKFPMPHRPLERLQSLDLSDNLMDTLPFSLNFFPRLKRLVVDGNPIRDLAPALNYQGLQVLSAQRTQIGWHPPSPLPEQLALKQLRILELGNNQLKAVPPLVKRCPQLQRLDLRNNVLTEPLWALCGLSQLRHLILEGNPNPPHLPCPNGWSKLKIDGAFY